MPVIGLAVGHTLAHSLGSAGHIVGGLLLIATGVHAAFASRDDQDETTEVEAATTGRLLLLGAVLSVDNLIVGFALGTNHADLALAVILIATVSVGLSLLGLELGNRLGTRAENHSEQLAALGLILVGVAILTNLLEAVSDRDTPVRQAPAPSRTPSTAGDAGRTGPRHLLFVNAAGLP
jgi:manganese efflux pump family protein